MTKIALKGEQLLKGALIRKRALNEIITATMTVT